MTTITINEPVNIQKTNFESIFDLYNYILNEYIDLKFVDIKNLNKKQKNKYELSKKLNKDDLFNV